MNIVSNSLLIAVFVFILLLVGIPGLDNKNLIQNKAFLFMSLFVFQLLMKSIFKLRQGCTNTNTQTVMGDALLVATSTIIGYSIFIDLLNMEYTRELVVKYTENRYSHALVIAFIIAATCFVAKLAARVIAGVKDECLSETASIE